MRITVLIILLFARVAFCATPFTEFYCDNATVGTSNVFSGSTTSATPDYSSFNGNWNGTSIYTPTDNSTPANTVSAGMWASVYVDGEIIATYIARVLTVAAGVNGAITLSTTAFALPGTAPSSSANARTIRVGGAWHGPGTKDKVGGQGGNTNYFPFGVIVQNATNNTGFFPRVNFKAGTTYSITNAISHAQPGPVRFEGYGSSPGDGTRAVIDGGTTVAAFILLTLASGSSGTELARFEFSNNGAAGNVVGVSLVTSGNQIVEDCVFHDIGSTGLNVASANNIISENEAYLCNKQNLTEISGISISGAGCIVDHCKSHDNTTARASGFRADASTFFYNCIAFNNGRNGFNITSGTTEYLLASCDSYNNSTNGIELASATRMTGKIKNSNFVKNGVYGIRSTGGTLRNGSIQNCGVGSGSMANGTGDFDTANLGSMNISGTVTYGSGLTPWSNPGAGSFSIILPAAKATGIGAFLETTNAIPTLSYPDIGAAQSASTNGGFAATFAQ